MSVLRLVVAGTLVFAALGSSARAQSTSSPVAAEQPAQPETSDKPSEQEKAPSIATSLPGPLVDPRGLRSSLEAAGIAYSLTYISEVLGNTRGGVRRDIVYGGRLDFQFHADLEKLAGLPSLAFHTNFYQIHGRGLSRCCLSNLLTVSGIEALPATRLYELWLEQKLLDGKIAIRAGQLAADTEFLVSQYGGLFVNATFGWPAITAANLPSGGPAYPLATPGLRVKIAPTDELSVMAAVFNGDPAGPGGAKDPQRRDRSGFEFRTTDPALLITEAAYTYNQGKTTRGLPGTFKLGGYHHLGRFDDQRFGIDGLSLADPLGSGLARRFRGNSGVYAVLDQLVYRVPGSTDAGIGLFARVSGSPSDRNLISFYADGGLTFKGLIPDRPDDTFGIAAGYAQVSNQARGLDRDARPFALVAGTDPATGLYGGPALPIRSSEALVEVTYQARVVPGFTVQPDFQYIFRPGGNVSNPRDPNGEPVRNAAVFGLRATIRY